MLNQIEFRNYRGFSQHILPLQSETVVVGRNNAGKSTVIEGFRLALVVTERYKNLAFKYPPSWLELPRRYKGVQPSASSLNLNQENIFHHCQDPPASITVQFNAGHELIIYLGPDAEIFSVMQDSNGLPVRSKGQAQALGIPRLSVLPQVAPLVHQETVLDPSYVRCNLSSYLAPTHFRNQLNLLYDQYFSQFKTLVENTWPDVQILELTGQGGLPNEELLLVVRDGDFAAEAAWMGHGLQMWLQTMWFLTRTSGHGTVVLDEPDIYMHPDLQRRLLRLLRGRHTQTVIATHSTEILAETEPNNVLILDRSYRKSTFTTELPAVQHVLEDIGSVQNLQLTKLWSARRLILVEGKDMNLLKRFHKLLFPESIEPLDGLPNMPIGGWSGWPYAIGSAMLLTNAVGQDIVTYCVLDSDYHTEETKRHRLDEAIRRNVQLHIWNRKETENYLIVTRAIERTIRKRVNAPIVPPALRDIEAAIDEAAEALKHAATDAIARKYTTKTEDAVSATLTRRHVRKLTTGGVPVRDVCR